ncbi:hypothetical protein ES705_29038 [subsurface metagenome]
MKSVECVAILRGMADNSEQSLDVYQVHALGFAMVLIRSLPPGLTECIDMVLDLEEYTHPH